MQHAYMSDFVKAADNFNMWLRGTDYHTFLRGAGTGSHALSRGAGTILEECWEGVKKQVMVNPCCNSKVNLKSLTSLCELFWYYTS